MIKIVDYLKDKTHVIWDWNGTLLSDVQHAVRIVNGLLAADDLPTINVQQYKQAFGFPVKDYYDRLGFNTEPEYFAELCEKFNQRFHEDLHHCELWPGVRETLESVKQAGQLQSVLSASEQKMLEGSLRQFEVSHLFDHIVGINDKLAGSKLQFGQRLLSRLSIPPEETILIGDTDHDLEVGNALGIDVILVDHGHQAVERLQSIHANVVTVLNSTGLGIQGHSV